MNMVLPSPLSRPPPIGRDRELALLQDRLNAARDGRGSLVLIAGEAGIGKTALTEELCRQAADSGAYVLTGHCYDRTETPPYGPWIQIARRLQSLHDRAIPPVPRLEHATSQAGILDQARDFLVALTAEHPAVLVLEDLHWADSASLDLLRFIARAIDDIPLLLVATYRSEDVDRRHPLAALVPLLVREAPTERLGLRPLDIAAAEALVRAHHSLPEADVHRLSSYLIERTEGNALFMTELLRSLEADGLFDRLQDGSFTEIVARTPVPALLKQIVDDRLNRLGDETAALLAVAAVVGQEVPLAAWQAVTQADEEMLLATVERAEAAHLVTASTPGNTIHFTHALIRDVLYEHVPALRRRMLHRQVGDALIALPAPDPDAVAHHFQQAGDERAVAWLIRAGERAEDAYALVTAAERYEAAFRLLDALQGDPAERGWLRLLAAALRRHEDLDRSYTWTEEAAQLAVTAGDSSLSARVQALRGLLINYRGNARTAVATIAAAMDMIDRLPPGTGASRREQQIDKVVNRGTLIAVLAHGGRLTEARRQGEAYLATFAESATSPSQLGAIADVHKGLAQAYAFQGEPELARQSYAATVAAYQASGNHVLALVRKREELLVVVLPYQADDLVERERVAAATERLADWVIDRGGHVSTNLRRYARIPLLVLEGQWHEARQILESSDTSDLALTSYVRPFYLGMLARAQGQPESAWRCVHERSLTDPEIQATERMRVGISLMPQFHRLAVELALDAGDLDAARNWLDRLHRWLDFMDATLGRSEAEVLEAAWNRARGDAVRAHAHAEQALSYATNPRQPLAILAARRMLGILETDAGNGAMAEAHVAQALALADACRAPYERALTLLAHAGLGMTLGDTAMVTVVLDEVRTICLPMNARLALAEAESIMSRLAQDGLSVAGPNASLEELTTREVEVLRLVATGLSNREIAERLFLSPNTVKVHVARVLAKIGVRNRAAATEFAIRQGIA